LRHILLTLTLISLITSVAPATAITVDITLTGGKAKVCITGTADITGKNLVTVTYRLLASDYKIHRNEFIELVEKGLRDYLREFLGKDVEVKVEQLEMGVREVYRNKTYCPDTITAIMGELEKIDSTYRVKAESGIGGQMVLVEIVFDDIEVYGSAKLVLAVALSIPVEHAEVWVYDFLSENWDSYSVPEMNATTKTWVELVFSETDMLRYVWGDRMRVRVYLDTTDADTPLELYIYSISLEVPTPQQTVFTENFCFVVEGIGEVGELGISSYDLRIRYMSPTTTLKSDNIEVKLPLLLLNLSAFKVPLEEWRWSFNGTHTVFTLHVPEIVYEHATEKFTVDPLARITVEGYAKPEGDKIRVLPPTLVGATVAITIAVLIAVLIALGKALQKQKQVIDEQNRRYVKRRHTRKT